MSLVQRNQPGRRVGVTLSMVLTGAVATILTFGGKLAAFFRDVVLATFFGAGSESDAFFIANTVPGVLWAAFWTTISLVFLPIYVRGKARAPEQGAKLAWEGTQIYLALGLLVGLLCALFAGPIVRLTAPDASETTLALARTLTVIMAAGFVFSGHVGVQNAIQQANGHFLAPLSIPFVNNLAAIAGIVVAAWLGDIRIAVAAMVLVWIVQSPIQQWQTRRYFAPRWVPVRGETVRSLTLLSVPVLLGTFLDQINIFIGLYLASDFGEGAISQLNYASRLALFLATTFSLLVSYFLFPRLSSEAHAGDDDASAKTLELGLLLIVGSTLPLAAITVLLSDDLVRLVYGHGALGESDIAHTAAALAFFAVSAVFVGVRELLNRMFFSQQRNVAPLMAGLVAAVANLIVSAVASRYMGLNGIALGASVAAILYCGLQVAMAQMWKPGLLVPRNLINFAWLLGASALALLPVALLLPALADWGVLPRLVTACLVYGTTFLLAISPLVRLRAHLAYRPAAHEGQ